MKKVYIGIPSFKDVPTEFMFSVVDMILYSAGRYQIMMSFAKRTFRNLAREQLIAEAQEVGADYILFLDDDMVFPNDTIDRLMSHDVPCVSALAFTRVPPHKPCLLQVKYANKDGEVHEEYEMWEDYPKSQLVEVAATGLACTLIKMEALQAINEPHCTAKEGAGEDIELMRKLRDKGYKVYCDTALSIGHLGERKVATEEDWLKYKMEVGTNG